MGIRRLGQVLVDLGFIDDDQLTELVNEHQNRPGELIGKVAQDMGLVTDEQLAQGVAEQFGLPVISLEETVVPEDVLQHITEPMAMLYKIVPVAFREGSLTVATCDPQKFQVLDELRNFLGFDVRAVVTTEADIAKALDRYYAASGESVESLVKDLENDAELAAVAGRLSQDGPVDLADTEALADSAPVRKLLNMIMLLAIKDRASDVHFEPFEHEFKIRIKADGVLYEMVPPPRHLAFAITTRIKVMANLDIAERRMPQDGRIELNVAGHPIDMRVAVCPTMFGESVVIRILDRSVVNLDLNAVGMNEATIEAFREIIHKPNGICLVTGPTGSGKTTTLYSALCELNDIKEKLITTEDPVEYDIDGIVQVPINAEIEVTFASCLRAILRQDPDRILVGEIRDYETAEIAIQAALTGHMVFSTLHTNDAPSTITRLRDMGVPTFLITATVEAILAQRLVRRICMECREEVSPRADLLLDLGMRPEDARGYTFYQGRGCENCNNSGYKGRVGLFELMIINDTLREMILGNSTTDELREKAREYGMVSLRDAGLQFILEGVTTIDEVIRETVLDA